MSHPRRLWLLAGLFICLVVTGCGRKGPLFLPEQKLREHLPPAQPAAPNTPPATPTSPSTPAPPPVNAP